ATLEKKADLTRYVTSIAMDDLDEVRAWLGYDKIVVWGISYGTRAAQEYLRRHPEHVAGGILGSVMGVEIRDPVLYAYDSQRALGVAFSDCAADAGCDRAFPHLDRTFEKVLDGFRHGPQTAHVRPSPDAAPVAVSYSLGDFGYTIRGML